MSFLQVFPHDVSQKILHFGKNCIWKPPLFQLLLHYRPITTKSLSWLIKVSRFKAELALDVNKFSSLIQLRIEAHTGGHIYLKHSTRTMAKKEFTIKMFVHVLHIFNRPRCSK